MAILRGLSIDAYHSNALISAGMVSDWIAKGPRYFHMKYIARSFKDEDTDDMRFGRLYEDIVCGKARLGRDGILSRENKLVCSWRHEDLRTKEGREWKERNGGLPSLPAKYLAMAEGMLIAHAEHRLALSMIGDCEQQVTLTGDIAGIEVQARPDFLCLSRLTPYSIDLKTTKSLTGFSKTVVDCNYHIQAALVRILLEQNGYENVSNYILAEEKEVPHRAEVYDLAKYRERAEIQLMTALQEIAHAKRTDEWPRTTGEIIDLEPPRWY